MKKVLASLVLLGSLVTAQERSTEVASCVAHACAKDVVCDDGVAGARGELACVQAELERTNARLAEARAELASVEERLRAARAELARVAPHAPATGSASVLAAPLPGELPASTASAPVASAAPAAAGPATAFADECLEASCPLLALGAPAADDPSPVAAARLLATPVPPAMPELVPDVAEEVAGAALVPEPAEHVFAAAPCPLAKLAALAGEGCGPQGGESCTGDGVLAQAEPAEPQAASPDEQPLLLAEDPAVRASEALAPVEPPATAHAGAVGEVRLGAVLLDEVRTEGVGTAADPAKELLATKMELAVARVRLARARRELERVEGELARAAAELARLRQEEAASPSPDAPAAVPPQAAPAAFAAPLAPELEPEPLPCCGLDPALAPAPAPAPDAATDPVAAIRAEPAARQRPVIEAGAPELALFAEVEVGEAPAPLACPEPAALVAPPPELSPQPAALADVEPGEVSAAAQVAGEADELLRLRAELAATQAEIESVDGRLQLARARLAAVQGELERARAAAAELAPAAGHD